MELSLWAGHCTRRGDTDADNAGRGGPKGGIGKGGEATESDTNRRCARRSH